MNTIFLNFEIFHANHHPTPHIKYKRINFAPCNKSILAKKASFNQLGTISKTD